MFFASNLKFLGPMYLPVAPQSNVGCFNVGMPSWCLVLTGLLLTPRQLSLTAIAMDCTTAFALTAACVMACV